MMKRDECFHALARHIEHWLESGTNPVDLPNALYAGRKP